MEGRDISTRPAWPYPADTEVHRRERSWTLIAGSRHLSFTRIDHHAQVRPRRVLQHDAGTGIGPRWPLTGLIALVLGSVAGLAMLGLALHATRAASVDPYRLSIAVPPKVVSMGTAIPRRRVSTTIAPPAAIPTKPTTLLAMPRVGPAEPPLPSDAEPARLTAMQPAIGAALRTGTLQQWASADGEEHGFVVAGPAERGCRTLSILTRRDGGNAVQTRRECAGDPGDGVAAVTGNTTAP